jgi:predicted DCC family thiol-disulfide oxidoreductase YuxK
LPKLLIYDGNCGFCRIWIEYWKKLTADRIDYAPYQEVADRFPQIPREAFTQAVQLVRTDGTVASGAHAVFETLGKERLYESSFIMRNLSETAYRFIAQRRNLFYQITRFTFGTKIEPATFATTQWIFLRLLAVIYAIAFASLGMQAIGLMGAQGIAPVHDFLARIAGSFGSLRFLALPTVFWWNSSDTMLRGSAIAGVALAALLFLGFFERLALLLLFILYLSFSLGGQEFLTFQWDALLLEAGFLAIFFGRSAGGLRAVAWLYRCLVFRLYFLSGYVKLSSHDPTWRDLTALKYHYHTQPLPNIIAWYADKLPASVQRASTFGVLAIELVAPFFIFTPRRTRMTAAFALLSLQVLILLTGNYTFFNLLTMALTLFLFDDRALSGADPLVRAGRPRPAPGLTKTARIGVVLLSTLLLTLGIARLTETIAGEAPEPLNTLARLTAPFEIVNSYGLFSVMTTSRPEIIVEGSYDGETWLPYEFRYKPGDLHRAPRWVAPFQPRLDWQMWFAALGNYQSNQWFVAFVLRLLQGSPAVVGLLEKNPFPDRPPRYIRALLYDYSFTDIETLRRTGTWWRREPAGAYLPSVGLKEVASAP